MPSIFIDKSVKPNNKMLVTALGPSYNYWESLKNVLEREYGALTEEWNYYGSKSGWSLKLLLKKRNMFFFVPCNKYFRLAFIFGDKAIKAAESSDLPLNMIQELKNARRYAEGRGLKVEVKKQTDMKHIVTLVGIKVNQ